MAIFRNGQTRSKAEVAAKIVGGGISLVWPALGLADAELKVFCVEHSPCPGRRATRLGSPQHNRALRRAASDYGPSHAWPFISPVDIHHNPHFNGEILTNPCIIGVEGQAGDLTASQRRRQQKEMTRCCIS